MHARGRGRPARRRAALLSALARDRGSDRAEPAHLRLRPRRHRTPPRRVVVRRPRAYAAGAVAAWGPDQGADMKMDYELLPELTELSAGAADMKRWRDDFPVLGEDVHGRPLVYLDNGATTQQPQVVIDAEANFYVHDNANVHRAVHALSQRATEAFEAARRKVQRFINAAAPEEIVFVRGTTEAINLA